MNEDDNIITAYRDHGVALASGLPAKNIMAEMMGKSTGVSKGMGGSMHLADKDKRFWGGWAIVGGHLPLAAGLALADQYNGDDRATVALMGDGSTNIGYFHEALNLSGVWKLPVVWIVENNQYGMGTAVTRASAVGDIAKKAEAYGMPCCLQVDGSDLLATYEMVQEGLTYAREGNGPYFLEIITYRYRGHSMGDPERYRPSDEVEKKKEEGDPITKWGHHLIDEELATQEDLEAMFAEAEQEVEEAVAFGHESEPLAYDELADMVYVD
jgi:pyruvate dehydrogenase E1 component alpha subunit